MARRTRRSLRKPPPSPLLLLPSELLLQISSYLPTPTLRLLTLASRRLYNLLTPVLFTRLSTDHSVRHMIPLPAPAHLQLPLSPSGPYAVPSNMSSFPKVQRATTLQWAALRGDAKLVSKMIENGWDVEETLGREGGCKKTPLALAAEKGDEMTVKALLVAGAKVNMGTRYGAMECAKKYAVVGWLADALLERARVGRWVEPDMD
ncbi:hypothetical protein K440DRAFT_663099 [Wilcoxina mikolae CBS 423.85]|nr:hypothetical protein K440DRAFT_663099 [Wilcoxina mikolae CBS 423.85]